MSEKLKNYGVILASGTGSRYGSDIPKQFVKIGSKTLLEWAIEVFEKSEHINKIILVITPEYKELAEDIVNKNHYKKIEKILNGGAIRKESSYIGINAIEENEANVLIHDCARPFVTEKIIEDCVEALRTHNAVNVAISSSDTIVEVENGFITGILDRKKLKRCQTPQCFKLSLIKKAHEISRNDTNFTDDCGLVVKYNLDKVFIVDGDEENIKITYPSDIYTAEGICRIRGNE